VLSYTALPYEQFNILAMLFSLQFGQNPDLKKVLFETAGCTIVEASPVDKIWGIGLSQDDPRASDRNKWRGTNWLGQTLTEVRDELLEAEK